MDSSNGISKLLNIKCLHLFQFFLFLIFILEYWFLGLLPPLCVMITMRECCKIREEGNSPPHPLKSGQIFRTPRKRNLQGNTFYEKRTETLTQKIPKFSYIVLIRFCFFKTFNNFLKVRTPSPKLVQFAEIFVAKDQHDNK